MSVPPPRRPRRAGLTVLACTALGLALSWPGEQPCCWRMGADSVPKTPQGGLLDREQLERANERLNHAIEHLRAELSVAATHVQRDLSAQR